MEGQVDLRQVQARFEVARNGLVNRRLADLNSTDLDAIALRLDEKALSLVDQLEEMSERASEALSLHDWLRFDAVRARSLEVTSEFEELREVRRQVIDQRHERHLEEQMTAILGSRARMRTYEVGTMALITLVLCLLLVQILGKPDEATAQFLDWIDVGVCVLFLGDFFWRLRLAESKKWFLRRYWLDFVTSIPLPASLLRAGRLVRFMRLARMMRFVRVLRVLRLILFFWRGMDKLAATLDVKLMRRSLKILAGVLLLGTLGIYVLEGHPRATGVESLGQSLWWSFTTVVTGGFGDIRNPETVTGRLLTATLIIAGMVIVGIFTATLTSVLVRESDLGSRLSDLEEGMRDEMSALRRHVDERLSRSFPPAADS